VVVKGVPGLGQITWRIMLTKKSRGHSGEKWNGNGEIAAEWSVGVWAYRAWFKKQ